MAAAFPVLLSTLAVYATSDNAGKVADMLGKLYRRFLEAAQDDEAETK